MKDYNDNEKINFDTDDYFERSGCGSIVVTLLIIALFWLVLGGIYLFT